MPLILQNRDKAETYKIKAGDTLESIAKEKCPDLGWKKLALYNWGTGTPKEMVRALSETIGVKVADLARPGLLAAPQKIELQPDKDLPAAALKIPKAWKQTGLITNKTHKVKVRTLSAANAVSITELDKWFIPKHEKCIIEYDLEGDGKRAEKVQLDVFGSAYCDCTAWSKGLGTYGSPASLVDEALYTKKDLKAEERQGDRVKWEGDVTSTKGMLGRKTGTAAKRHINVAFSPYTAHFRYWKAAADKDARLILEPFWPEWEEDKVTPAVTSDLASTPAKASWTNAAAQDYGTVEVLDAREQRVHLAVLAAGKLRKGAQNETWDKRYRQDACNGKFETTYIDDSAVAVPLKELLFKSTPYKMKVTTVKRKLKAASLKIKWEIKKATKLKQGLLQISDSKGKLIFQKPLPKGKLATGKHEIAWDGKYAPDIKNSKDGTEAIPEDMPYRAQIQAHTEAGEADGLALASMHSEVRLYVHKENYAPKDIRHDSWVAKPSLALAQGPLVPGSAPGEGDGTKWYRYKLAEYGFHPGPVNAPADADFKTALKEFKRSVPANGSLAAPNFTRLRLDGNNDEAENAETKTALRTIRASDKRNPFGDPAKVLANNDAPDLIGGLIDTRLRDPAQEIVVWVDDRQYNTAQTSKDENNHPFLSGANDRLAFGLKDYRGGMVNGDGKVTTDAGAITRPWVPLKTDLALLSRTDELWTDYAEAKVQVSSQLREAMRRAIGPLRVDWTFEELPTDLSTINVAGYDKKDTRSRKYVAWAVDQKKGAHTRADTGRKVSYTNCLDTLGGIRPAAAASYQEKAFGLAGKGLAPWEATAVAATESVATVVHDHIGAAQTAGTDLFEPLIGTAGAYFHPSRIAGDGYRVRSEVKLEKFAGYDFPNLEALKGRYPALPQAHSARLRVWRRSSIRGYMCWASAATGHFPNLISRYRDLYRAAHVYFVHEGGTAQSFNTTDVFNPATPAHQTRYKNTLSNNLTDNTLKLTARMQLRSDDIWPWGHRNDMGGAPWRSGQGIAFGSLYSDWLSPNVISPTWRKFRAGLLLALVKEVEGKGFLRGHLLVEFDASPAVFLSKFTCNGATPHTYYYLKKNGTASPAAHACPAPGCAGTLSSTGTGSRYANGLPLPAVGVALGATWLFTNPANADTWVHEVGHHRHCEHAAAAPGSKANLHDAQKNDTQNWGTRGEANVKKQNWDRMCIMSYQDPPNLYFCGRCLLRNRGWKVTGLGSPGTEVKEPA